MEELLRVEDLKTYFFTHEGTVKAVDGVSFTLNKGETLGLVGESGCGKSVTALSIMRLVQSPPGKIVGGKIIFEGKDLLELEEKEMRKIRGKKISMIFQEPMTSLDPMFTIGSEIMEVLSLHQGLKKDEAKKQALESLKKVRFPDPEKRIDDYPHELSGGMRQRAMIAMALTCNPALLIADEPTTALDVTIQAQILRLIDDLRKEFSTSVIMITHDLGVIAKTCDNVGLMYAGMMMEYTDVRRFFRDPLHPYAKALMKSIPRLDTDADRLKIIEGLVPNLLDLPTGCPFHPRCEYRFEPCPKNVPPLLTVEPQHLVRCYLYGGY